MTFSILEVTLIVFFTALIVGIIFRFLNLSVILGYLVVGALVGPHGFGWVPDSEYINSLAEFGIVFLMFTVGLEFSLSKLYALRHSVFVVGSLQVVGCVVVTLGVTYFFGMPFITALVMGSIVAMSSTALVVKQLNDQFELQSPAGLNAMGVLLFQDLAVIPLVILITSLSSKNGGSESLSYTLLWALAKGLFAIGLIFIMGRWVLQPLLKLIAKINAIELFTLTVLLITLAAAWVTEALGLSYSLGAFLGGVMLAETTYRHQIEIEIRPFRDILLGLFFITIGMLTNIHTWSSTWMWILLLVLALTVLKMVLITLFSALTRNYFSTCIRTGLILAQGGEFGFAIIDLAMDDQLLSPYYEQIILAALLISIAIAPVLIRFNKQIAAFLSAKSLDLSDSSRQHTIKLHAEKLYDHVIISGYGRVGQHIARMLDNINVPYIAIDQDAELVQRATLAGDEVLYGDSSHPEMLDKASISQAKVLLISLTDLRATIKILTMARALYPDLPILVRCRDRSELDQLKKLGATHIIVELFEASLTLSNHLLQILKFPRAKILDIIQDVRSKDYDLLHKVFVGTIADEELQDQELSLHEQLCPIVITEDAYSVNHKLSELGLIEMGVEVIAIRRGNKKRLKPRGTVKILVNDIIILYGSYPNLEIAERKILEGHF